MELKALGLYQAESLDYRYDWASVYKQPMAFPVILVPDADLKSGGMLTARLTFAGQTVTGTGTDTIRLTLPERICYPVGATLELLNGSVSRGSVEIPTDNELEGFYPGDTYRVMSAPSGLPAYWNNGNGYSITVFPNPFTRRTAIRVEGVPASLRVAVYSVSGKRVFRAGGQNLLIWDASGLSQGLYFIRAETETGVFVRKVLLER